MTSDTDIKKEVNEGLKWVGMASSMVGVLDLVAQVIILAFWITPAQFGAAVAAISLFPILDKATDMGLSAAVIQRDDHTPEKISTVFWLNLAMSLVMFASIAFLFGPALSSFHGKEVIGALLTLYGTKLIWQNVYFMPSALMRREMRFRELSIIRMFANVAEFAGKVGFAPIFGVWCFVLGPLCRVLVTGIGTQICYPWRPKFVLRIREAMDWFWFGVKTSSSQVLFFAYTNVDYQIVGFFWGHAALGFYKLAYDIVLDPCRIMADVVTQIAFPAFAKIKHQTSKLVDQFIAFAKINLVVLLAFLGAIFIPAEELLGFWGAKWAPTAPAIRVLCLVGVLRALSFIVPPLLDGIGKPGLTLIYMLVAAIALPTSFMVAAHLYGYDYYPVNNPGAFPYPGGWDLGFMAMCWAWAVGYPFAFAVLFVLALRQLRLRVRTYLARTMGIPLCAGVAVLVSWGVIQLLGWAPFYLRFVVTAASMVAVFFVLLAYTQGISPRTVKAALKGD